VLDFTIVESIGYSRLYSGEHGGEGVRSWILGTLNEAESYIGFGNGEPVISMLTRLEMLLFGPIHTVKK
jgi:hypothetical protein